MNASDAKLLNSVIDGFFGQRILVLGDVMLDITVGGPSHRRSPEDASAPVILQQYENVQPGGAANAAMCLRSLGAEVTLCGVTGADKESESLRSMLAVHEISSAGFLQDKSRVTTRKTRIEIEQRQIARIDKETVEPLSLKASMLLGKAIMGARADGMFLSDYNKGVLTHEVMLAVRERVAVSPDLVVLADPKARPPELYAGVHHLTPNAREFSELNRTTAARAMSDRRPTPSLLEDLGLDSVLVTQGAEGAELHRTSRGLHESLPRFLPQKLEGLPVEVRDVSGAGDASAAAYLLAILAGADLSICAHLANIVGALSVEKWGPGVVSSREVREYIQAQCP